MGRGWISQCAHVLFSEWSANLIALFSLQLFHSRILCKYTIVFHALGFPGGSSGKEPTCQCRRHKRCGFDPWVTKISRRRKWQPTPVLLPGRFPWTEEPGGLQSMGSQRVGHD